MTASDEDDDFLLDTGDAVSNRDDERDEGDDSARDSGTVLPPPRQNPWLFGQEDAERTLLAMYLSGKLPHALILSGPPGIGKATLAYRFARFLLTEGERQSADAGLFGAPTPVSLQLPPENAVFRRVSSGGHADLLTVEREFDEKKGAYKSEIPVDEVRKVTPFLRKTASEGGWRVVVVDGAEALNLNGQNALLKILEEPPAKVVLILTTSHPGLFLPTVRSRCRVVACRSLPEGVVIKLLDQGAPNLGGEEKKALARLSGGSIGRALELAEQGGLPLYQALMDVMASGLDWGVVHKMADQMGQQGSDKSYKTTMDLLSGWLMRMARAASRGAIPELVVPGEKMAIESLARRKSPQGWLEAWEKVTNLVRQAEDSSLDRRQTILEVFAVCGEA